MEKSIIATGKTIELAVEAALTQLGLDRDSVSVQVLQQAKSGFLGFGAQPAKVQVSYEAPDPKPEAPKTALSSASRSKPRVKAPEVKKEAPKAEPVKPEMPKPAPKAEAPQVEAPKTEAPKRQTYEKRAQAPKAAPKTYAPAQPGSFEEKIEQFIKGLIEKMGSDVVPHAWQDGENSYRVDLVGADLGYLIGRRGETLDAIQHLTNYTLNRSAENHVRVNVDAEQFRQRREESLRHYARKKAQQVLKYRRRTTLEPMNAYERHVVHAALQEIDNITTHSTGSEPNRRVVIEYIR